MRAMRLAALRALVTLPVRPDVIVLDGNHDYLSPREEQGELFAAEPDWPEVVIPQRVHLDKGGHVLRVSVCRKRVGQDIS